MNSISEEIAQGAAQHIRDCFHSITAEFLRTRLKVTKDFARLERKNAERWENFNNLVFELGASTPAGSEKSSASYIKSSLGLVKSSTSHGRSSTSHGKSSTSRGESSAKSSKSREKTSASLDKLMTSHSKLSTSYSKMSKIPTKLSKSQIRLSSYQEKSCKQQGDVKTDASSDMVSCKSPSKKTSSLVTDKTKRKATRKISFSDV